MPKHVHTHAHTRTYTHPHWRLQTSINHVFKYCVYIKQQNSAKYTCTAYVVQECNFCLGRSQKQTLHIKVNTRKMTIPLNTISTPRSHETSIQSLCETQKYHPIMNKHAVYTVVRSLSCYFIQGLLKFLLVFKLKFQNLHVHCV